MASYFSGLQQMLRLLQLNYYVTVTTHFYTCYHYGICTYSVIATVYLYKGSVYFLHAAKCILLTSKCVFRLGFTPTLYESYSTLQAQASLSKADNGKWSREGVWREGKRRYSQDIKTYLKYRL